MCIPIHFCHRCCTFVFVWHHVFWVCTFIRMSSNPLSCPHSFVYICSLSPFIFGFCQLIVVFDQQSFHCRCCRLLHFSASPAPRARHTSPSYPPPSRKPVFGWLLHNKSIINWRPSKATMYFYFFYFLPLHSTPQTMGQRPPHVPPRSRLLSNAPLTVDDNFRLVIVSPHQTAAI